MPEEQIYQRRIGTAGPQQAVLSDARDFGAGVGGAIARLGEQQHVASLRAYRLDRQEQAASEQADFARKFAQARLEDSEAIRKSRDATPDAKGHGEAVAKMMADRRAALLDGITEDDVRRSAEAQFDGWATNIEIREGDYEALARTNWQLTQNEETVEASENLIGRSGGDDALYADELAHMFAAIDAIDGPAAIKEQRKLEVEQRLAVQKLSAHAAKDPEAAKLELASGRWDAVLTAKQIETANREADLEIKARAIEAEAKAQEARVAARNAMETIEARFEAGEDVPKKDVEAAISMGKAAKLPAADLIRFTTKSDDAKILRAFSLANDPDGARSAAAAAEIADKIREGTASPAEYRMYEKLVGYADARAVDVGDKLKELAGTGLSGQQAALAEIDKMPASSRFATAERLGDGMGYVAMAKPQTRQAILSGMADIAANKDIVDAAVFEREYRKALGGGAQGMSEASIEGRMQAAMGYYAHYAKAKGVKPDKIDPAIFSAAMKVSFGAERRKGVWQGGVQNVRGKAVRIPDGYTSNLFDARMSKLTFADAVYRNGERANKADILTNWTPVFVGNDAKGNAVYHFIDASGNELKMKDGRAFPMVMD